MKSRRMQATLKKVLVVLLPALGILSILGLSGLMWWWESVGRQSILYEEVLVLKQDVQRGELIKESMLDTVRFEKARLIDHPVRDPKEIVGLEARQYIPKNSQLDVRYFESPELITDKDRLNFKIPNDWIYSIPNSLRRKDRIALYAVDRAVLQDAKNKKIQIEDASTGGASGNPSTPEYVFTEDVSGMVQGEPVLITIVSYVKDSVGREVVSIGEGRMNANSAIKDIEIVDTVENLRKLEGVVKEGSKFIVMYAEGEEG